MIWHRSLRYTTFPTRRWTSTPGPRKTSWSTGPTRPTPWFIAESPLVIGPCAGRRVRTGVVPDGPQHITGKGAEILGRCDPDLPVYTASLEVLTQLTGFHLTRGMLCAMRRPPLPSVAEVCAGARASPYWKT